MIDAREYLSSFRKAEARLKLKIQQLQDLQDRLTSFSAPMDRELVSHTKNTGTMADTIAIVLDMKNEISSQSSEIIRRKQEAYGLLDQISPENAIILMAHYFEGESLTQLGNRLHIVKRTAQRRLNDALEEFQDVLDRYDSLHSAN